MSAKSAKLIQHLLFKYQLTKVQFVKLTGVSRASLYKYLEGEPIHPYKARAIVAAFKQKYRITIPLENLID